MIIFLLGLLSGILATIIYFKNKKQTIMIRSKADKSYIVQAVQDNINNRGELHSAFVKTIQDNT